MLDQPIVSTDFGEITDMPELIRSFTGRMDGMLDFHLLELAIGQQLVEDLIALVAGLEVIRGRMLRH